MKVIRPCLLRIVEFSLVESVTCVCFRLHEGRFRLQLITFLVGEKPTWNSTWQVWIFLVTIVEEYQLLKVDLGGVYGGPWGPTNDNLLNTYFNDIYV